VIRKLVPLVAGIVFAVGLVLGGMTQPAKVIGFLDFTGRWDASLLFVMGGAVLVHTIAYRLVIKRGSPLFDSKFHLPTRRDLDGKLLLGAAIFGLGWGLGGFCPGPALAGLASGKNVILFVAAMLSGMWLHDQRARSKAAAAERAAGERREVNVLAP